MVKKNLIKLRQIINEPRKQFELFQRRRDWSKLCTCIDTIEDTESAIEYYLGLSDFSALTGGYLYIYGVLQALFLQQDATVFLYDGIFGTNNYLKDEFSKNPNLKYVREIRNDSIGHPTNRNNKSYHSIVQHTVSKVGFEMSSDLGIQNTIFSFVNIIDIINLQQTEIDNVLDKIVSKLMEEIKMHKEKYENDNLERHFKMKNYCIEKLSSCLYTPTKEDEYNETFAFKLLEGLFQNYVDFYNKTEIRYGFVSDAIKYLDPKIKYVYTRVNQCKLEKGLYQNIEATILIDALRIYLTEMEAIAVEIDNEYVNDNQSNEERDDEQLIIIIEDNVG